MQLIKMAEEYPRARDACASSSLSRVRNVSAYTALRAHPRGQRCAYKVTVNYSESACRDQNKPEKYGYCLSPLCCLWNCHPVSLQQVRTEKDSCARRVRIPVPLFAPLSQTDSTVFESRHRRLGQCLQRLLLNSSEDEARSLLA